MAEECKLGKESRIKICSPSFFAQQSDTNPPSLGLPWCETRWHSSQLLIWLYIHCWVTDPHFLRYSHTRPSLGGTSFVDLLCFFSVMRLLCLCTCLFICALWSPAGKGLTSWLLFVVSNCEFVTFPLVSWVRCGT